MDPIDLPDAVHDKVYRLLVEHGVDEVAALQAAAKLLDELSREVGGQEHYWPAPDKTTRNRRIVADLAQGLKPVEVAQKHRIHPRTVEKIRAQAQRDDGLGFGTKDWVL